MALAMIYGERNILGLLCRGDKESEADRYRFIQLQRVR
jgi:hypothetical protein